MHQPRTTIRVPQVRRFSFFCLTDTSIQLFIGALLVYDVTDEDSFQRATNWYKELIHEIGRDAPIILAGNKCDIMNHTVSKEDADQFARSKGIEHVQASALSGNNVDYIFTTLAESKFRLHYFPNYILFTI